MRAVTNDCEQNPIEVVSKSSDPGGRLPARGGRSFVSAVQTTSQLLRSDRWCVGYPKLNSAADTLLSRRQSKFPSTNSYLLEEIEVHAVSLFFSHKEIPLFETSRNGSDVHGRHGAFRHAHLVVVHRASKRAPCCCCERCAIIPQRSGSDVCAIMLEWSSNRGRRRRAAPHARTSSSRTSIGHKDM
jgi:hypothetical protein